jgi:hypothetical protein
MTFLFNNESRSDNLQRTIDQFNKIEKKLFYFLLGINMFNIVNSFPFFVLSFSTQIYVVLDASYILKKIVYFHKTIVYKMEIISLNAKDTFYQETSKPRAGVGKEYDQDYPIDLVET